MAARRHIVGRAKRKLYTERVRLDRQGYTRGGQYYGTGAPLYRVSDDEGNETVVRAASSKLAKENALPEIERQEKRTSWREFERKYPGAKYEELDSWIKAGKP